MHAGLGNLSVDVVSHTGDLIDALPLVAWFKVLQSYRFIEARFDILAGVEDLDFAQRIVKPPAALLATFRRDSWVVRAATNTPEAVI